MPRRTSRLLVFAVISATALGVFAGCGDDDDDTADETTTTEAVTTAPVEDSVQQAVDGAVSSCTDSAAEIQGEAARNTAVTACEEVGRSLDQEVASLSASARENTDAALTELAAKCRTRATEYPRAQEQILAGCDQLAAGGA